MISFQSNIYFSKYHVPRPIILKIHQIQHGCVTMATCYMISIFSVAFEREMFKGYIQPNDMQVLIERFNISAGKFRQAKQGEFHLKKALLQNIYSLSSPVLFQVLFINMT